MKQPVAFGGPVNGNTASMVDQAARLLDFTQKLDINLLDHIVNCMYTGEGPKQKVAQQVLTALKEHSEAWTRVDTILEFSKSQQTKYYGLQILENAIKTRWKVLPRNQQEGIEKYIVSLIIVTSSNPLSLEREKVCLNKLNMILVQILKREWPKNWPTFISDIVVASKNNESLCQNNMYILKILSEEVFDFSSGQMTQAKAKHLKATMCNEFPQIFQLCDFVMANPKNPILVHATLETLLRFLNWIPLGYIFETKLIYILIYEFLSASMYRNITLKCLTEIAGVRAPCYDEIFISLFTQTTVQLQQILPEGIIIKEAYAKGQDSTQKFIQNLSLFFCTFLKEHGALIEQKAELKEILLKALHYLLLTSEVEEIEIFKICLEHWNALAASLYHESPSVIASTSSVPPQNSVLPPRRLLYKEVLTKLRYIMIGRMAKPEEVLVVENEHGEAVREFMKDTDSIQLYKTMRETLVYLTHLDYADTERIMTEELRNQRGADEKKWSRKNLNTLCWAIGSISGAMNEEDEKRFLVAIMKDLLGLCEQKRGKDNKAIIASNIMYVVGQYPRFLRAHWPFLKTVVYKLFEFMHETHKGVQDMACDTFIKIAQKCQRHFIEVQEGEVHPFIDEILSEISRIICALQPYQVHLFYKAIGCMIAAQDDSKMQETLIVKYMSLPNKVWDVRIQQATKCVDVLKQPEAVKQIGNVLKTNISACKALGHPYLIQLRHIYLDMLNIYEVMSENINSAISQHGEIIAKQRLIQSMQNIKKETLRLISEWVNRCTDPEVVLEELMPPLLDVVLLDYQKCTIPSACEPEVLSTMAAIVNKLEKDIAPVFPKIFDAVFYCTLEMINKDFEEEVPESRTNFVIFLQAAVTHCFPTLLALEAVRFKLMINSIIWAFKHAMRNVADIGLQILYRLLQNIARREAVAQSFYQNYYTDILQHLFSVVMDTSHTAGLTMQATILAYMFSIVETDEILVPLNPIKQADGKSNVSFVQDFVVRLLKAVFEHLSNAQIKMTVQGFFHLDQDVTAFKEHLSDFLVQAREFAGEDDWNLWKEDREDVLRLAEEKKRKIQSSQPSIMSPHETPEDMQN